ncbi:tRNA (guanosine(18)-2'-O)-methyltransferase TrmH [Thermus islandicus]|uniref:tRNA (guanosine(18)-2'-O)-methyltransferase TrmH n=1 Tax=Thermus islandicus TaxID=540988 RepID=UPI0003B678DE|nr:tRNA (guanosine(18)-2'-O)-methyltransferase TrmH [Thermus islandicus]
MREATPERRRRLEEVLSRRQPDLTVLLENVHKPHNLSAILRTCDAVGVLEAHAVNPTGGVPTFNETSGGSHKWVYLRVHESVKEAFRYLKEQGFRVYATALREDARDFREVDYTKPVCVLLGAEKWGVSEEALALADGAIKIPMLGMVQSLNVSVAAAVILFEAQRQRLKAGLYDRPRLDPELYQKVLADWLRK